MRIGIDLGGTKIEVIAIDPRGGERFRHRVATPKGSYEKTIKTIVDLVATTEAQIDDRCTVGVGIPGTVSPATGLIKNANSTWLIGHPFDRDLEAALNRPVRLANDANCFALSEASDGAGADARTVFGVILGTGVGGGLVVDKELVAGANAIAGEWGHNPLPWPADEEVPGPRCWCGKLGCIEAFLSGPALERAWKNLGRDALSAAEIVDLAARDRAAEGLLTRYEDRLARALATVINIFDPETIVLGGGLSNLDRLFQSVPTHWQRYAFSDEIRTSLRPPVHGDASGVRGAAWLWPAEPSRDQQFSPTGSRTLRAPFKAKSP